MGIGSLGPWAQRGIVGGALVATSAATLLGGATFEEQLPLGDNGIMKLWIGGTTIAGAALGAAYPRIANGNRVAGGALGTLMGAGAVVAVGAPLFFALTGTSGP